MSPKKFPKGFDPYHRWFGIPPGKRPPTHYQLLGIASDESSSDVIAAAADRQTEFVNRFSQGEHAEVAQTVLYEIEEAKLCLLSHKLRSQYDARLSQKRSNTRRKSKSLRPASSSRGTRTVGEETEIVRSFAGVVSILVVAFLVVIGASFLLPWKQFFADDSVKMTPPQAAAPDADKKPDADEKQNGAQPAVAKADVAVPQPKKKPNESKPEQKPPAAKPNTEGGWVSLFNGQNLDGWKYATTDQSNNRENTTWSVDVDQGIIVSTGGDSNRIETEQEFQDFVFTMEYREFAEGEPARADSGLGVLVRAKGNARAPLAVAGFRWMNWVNDEQKKAVRKRGKIIELDPNAVEVKLGNHHGGLKAGSFHVAGTSIKHPNITNKRKPAKKPKKPIVLFMRTGTLKPVELKPDGGWNSCKIRCQGEKLTVHINDQLVNEATGLEIRAGNIAIRNQSARAEIRNVRIQPLSVSAKNNERL